MPLNLIRCRMCYCIKITTYTADIRLQYAIYESWRPLQNTISKYINAELFVENTPHTPKKTLDKIPSHFVWCFSFEKLKKQTCQYFRKSKSI